VPYPKVLVAKNDPEGSLLSAFRCVLTKDANEFHKETSSDKTVLEFWGGRQAPVYKWKIQSNACLPPLALGLT